MLNVVTQLAENTEFLKHCLDTLVKKSPDYAPEDVVFLDVFEQAADLGKSPEEVLLLVLTKKHLTALRRYVRYGNVRSETPRSRTRDVVNYMAMLDLLLHNRATIGQSIADYWRTQPCEGKPCGYPSDERQLCDRCRNLMFAQRYATSYRNLETWSLPIPSVPDSSTKETGEPSPSASEPQRNLRLKFEE